MACTVPESWYEWGAEGDQAPRPGGADMLAAKDFVTANSRKAQQKLDKLIGQGQHATHTAFLDQLPETARLPGPDDPLRGRETKNFAKARYRSLQGTGATACLRTQQQTRSVSYPHHNSWELEGASWGLRSTWQ